MNAYDAARLDDFAQRVQLQGETLTPKEQAQYDRLCAARHEEEEIQPRPHWYGGDYPDL